MPEAYLKDRLSVLLGGRVAEKALLGSVSSGADDDIRQASALARAMVARWGMAEEIGPVDLRHSEEHPFLGREIPQPQRFSPVTAHEIDEAVVRLLNEAEERAGDIVQGHPAELARLIERLEHEETLDRGQIDACLGPAHGRQGRAEPPAAAAE